MRPLGVPTNAPGSTSMNHWVRAPRIPTGTDDVSKTVTGCRLMPVPVASS